MNTPIVILNYKTYLESSGENALELARALKSASEESGITMVAAPQAADIYRIQDQISLPIFAQHIDPITPGGHTGSNLIETLIEAGISGSLINHSENRMKLADIDEVIQLKLLKTLLKELNQSTKKSKSYVVQEYQLVMI